MTIEIKRRSRVPGALDTTNPVPGGRVPGPLRIDFDDFSDFVSIFEGPAVRVLDRVWHRGGSGLPSFMHVNGMDDEGEQILGTYLYGGGVDHDIEDEDWTAYMTAHENLRGTLIQHVRDQMKIAVDRKQTGRFPIADRFHYAFPENSGFSGYALLHGSNAKVGDFLMAGFVEVTKPDGQPDGAYDLAFELRYVFNDIVDPNTTYWTDTVRAFVATLVTVGSAHSYRLGIHFGANCTLKVRPGQELAFSGYPFEKKK